MGRAKVFGLLAKLEENRQRQAIVDAAIFTVAQVAVDELRERSVMLVEETKALPPVEDLTPTWNQIWGDFDRLVESAPYLSE